MLEPLTRGRMTVEWTPAGGLRVDVDGVPLVRSSTFYIVKEGWTGVLFNPSAVAWTSTGWMRGDGAATARFVARTPDAEVEYTIVATDRSVSTEMRYTLLRDVPAEVEYAAAYLSAALLTGQWTSDVARGILAEGPPAPGRSQAENRLGPPWRRLSFASPRGDIDLAWSGNAGLPVSFDARSDAQGWAKAWPVLWTGLGSPPKPLRMADGTRTARLSIVVGPAPERAPDVATMQWSARGRRMANLVEPPAPVLLPTPKRRSDMPGRVRLAPDIVVVAPADTPATRRLLDLLQEAIGRPPKRAERPPDSGACIVLGDPALRPPDRPEGYALVVERNRVSLAGRDAAGLGWAVETLAQLIRTDAAGAWLGCTRIDDWPTLAFRGVHLFHGARALPFHRKLIDRVFAPGKLNQLLLQCEQVRWSADPAVAPPWAGTPDQLREEIIHAKSRGIRVHPLIQGYGHMEWLFANGANRDFAEDPETPYAVHFDNPKARAYLERFVDEANTLFASGATHVGLDEVTMRGRFPYRSAGRSFPDLFTTAVRHWRDFLAERGAETWMWADMLLHPSEVAPCFGTSPSVTDARAVRERMPRDIVLFDWQYEPRPRYPSLDLLRREGFAKRVAAAEHFWNGGATPVPEDAGERFARAWRQEPRGEIAPSGISLRANGDSSDARLLPRNAFPTLVRDRDGTGFPNPSPSPLADLCGPGGRPLELVVDLPPGTYEIRLLLAATRRAPAGAVVAEVAWDSSGSAPPFMLVQGVHIAAVDDPTACTRATAAYEGVSRAGSALRLRSVAIPTGGARTVRLRAVHPASAPVLYGIACLPAPAR